MSEPRPYPVSQAAAQVFISGWFARDHLVSTRGVHLWLVLDLNRKEWQLHPENAVLPRHTLDLDTFAVLHRAAVATQPLLLVSEAVDGQRRAVVPTPAAPAAPPEAPTEPVPPVLAAPAAPARRGRGDDA